MKNAAPTPGKRRQRARPARIMKRLASRSFRREVYNLLDQGSDEPLAIAIRRTIIALIILSVAGSVLITVPSLVARFGSLFSFIELIAVAAFSLEYLARLWVAVEHPPYRDMAPWRARLAYLVSPAALIDLVAIAPFYLELLGVVNLPVLLVLRLLRFLKLTRYSPGMRSLADAVQSERTALLSCLMFLIGLALISASFMQWAEHDAQPDKFGTVPDALYWAMITLSTVGYGDVVPITTMGKLVASFTAVFGIAMLALPVGILATSFAQVIQRRDFVVTWSMVARVPLFNELPAADIADIMRYLNSLSAEAGEVVVRKGDVAHSMYFIATGEVSVEVPGQPVRLGEGHFFGEIALLKRSKRSATVRATVKTKLLVLDATDLQGLVERKPHIGEVIERVARERMNSERVGRFGDLASGELSDDGQSDGSD